MDSPHQDLTELRKEVNDYTPGSESECPDAVNFPRHLIIGLFGKTGCGKTSLINSLKYTAAGALKRKQWLQVAPQDNPGAHTMYRKAARITEKIYVVDNRGLDDATTDEALDELGAQLDGKRGYSDIVEWQENASNKLDLKGQNAIGCAVFVFSAGHDVKFNTRGLKKVVDFVHKRQGRYPVGVITNVDNHKLSAASLKTVLHAAGVSDVFEVANITDQKRELELIYQHSLLSFLGKCMVDGDETYIFKHYLNEERKIKQDIEKKRELEKREAWQREVEQLEKEATYREQIRQAEEDKRRMQEREDRYFDAIREAEYTRNANDSSDTDSEDGTVKRVAKGVGVIGTGAAAGAGIGVLGGPIGSAIGAVAGGTAGLVGYMMNKMLNKN